MKIILLLSLFFNTQAQKSHKGSFLLEKEILITWIIKDFKKERHQLNYCKTSSGIYLCEIDKQIWYGSDRNTDLPKNELASLTITIGSNNYQLLTTAMYNPNFGNELYKSQFSIKKFSDHFMLYGYFSDGAGTYTAHWKILPSKAIRKVISVNEEDFEWQLDNT